MSSARPQWCTKIPNECFFVSTKNQVLTVSASGGSVRADRWHEHRRTCATTACAERQRGHIGRYRGGRRRNGSKQRRPAEDECRRDFRITNRLSGKFQTQWDQATA